MGNEGSRRVKAIARALRAGLGLLPVACIIAALAAGCRGRKEAEPGEPKSTARTAIEGFTGKSAVDAGRRATGVIHRVSSQQQEGMDEFFGPEKKP